MPEQPEQRVDQWPEILRETVTAANSNQPRVGTQFRAAVASAAAKRGLQFPLPSEPQLRFIQLLERYPTVVSIMRRPGQDFLVVPAGRSDLLAKGIQGRSYGIRNDFFLAFTTVSDSRPYYDKSVDRVVWQKFEEGRALPDSWVAIEPTTEAEQIQIRRDFAAQYVATHPHLLDTLNQPLPLSAFGKAVRTSGLQRPWHSFRTERVLEKIQRWAKEKQIEWKDAWLTEGRTDYDSKRQAPYLNDVTLAERDPLQVLFSGLDKADIQRISIPLDLVLKAISLFRKR